MKKSPQDKEILVNLGPSKFSSEGFLCDDDRPLDEIIATDIHTLKKLGITKDQFIHALKNAYNVSKDAFGAETEIMPGVTGVFFESMGRIPSPFRYEGTFEKGEAVITDTKSGDSIVLSSLSIHLIEKHDFYQGRGCHYRIDPEKAARILKLI